jgi:rfaE bifunctional protein nucleotidyltransferase chain/domain
MGKIFTIEQAIKEGQEIKRGKMSIVLAGGCFDILHVGHIEYLDRARENGDRLFVFLESDEMIAKSKGRGRPINNQEDRARILSSLMMVDAVIKLPASLTDSDYDDIVNKIKPDVIAVTKGDKNIRHKARQSILSKIKLMEVNEVVSDKSTSRLVKLLAKEL